MKVVKNKPMKYVETGIFFFSQQKDASYADAIAYIRKATLCTVIRKANTVFFFMKRNTSATQIRVRLNLYKSVTANSVICLLLLQSFQNQFKITGNFPEKSPQMGMPWLSFDSQRASPKMQSSTSPYVLPTKEPTIPIKIFSRNALHGGRLEYYNDNV